MSTGLKKITQKSKDFIKNATQKVKSARLERKKGTVHRSFRVSRRSELPKLQKMPSSWRLLKRTCGLLWNQKSIVIAMLIVYIIIAWAVSGMFALTNFTDIKAITTEGQSLASFAGLSALFNSFFMAQSLSYEENRSAIIMLNLASLLFWLAFIWVARYEVAKKVTSVREALYTSGTTLVPFLLVLAVLFIQCIPGLYALSIINNIATGMIFTNSLEVAAFSLLALLMIVFSVYFVVSTITALQIVALPGMYPWKALKSARELMIGRRFAVLRKYIVLMLAVGTLWVAIFTPTLLLENAICGPESCWAGITILPFVYYGLLAVTVALVSTYLYVTYRSLLELQEQ